jgi:predicted metal-binding membrane protein
LLDPMMAGTSRMLGGIILITAGIYQWAPLKDACLAHCQSPLLFVHRHGGFQRASSGSLLLGLRHGAYCVGCCWALMALLFVGGIMNVLWIAAISAFALIEKIVPAGRLISRVAGIGFAAAGVWLAVASG